MDLSYLIFWRNYNNCKSDIKKMTINAFEGKPTKLCPPKHLESKQNLRMEKEKIFNRCCWQNCII